MGSPSLYLLPSPASQLAHYRQRAAELRADLRKRREQARIARKVLRDYRARVARVLRAPNVGEAQALREVRLLAEAESTLQFVLGRFREDIQELREWQVRIAKAHAAEAEARSLS